MKKQIGVLLLSFFMLTNLIAQKLPAGRELFVLAYEFAQDETDAWTSARITKFDLMNNEYVVSGYCVQKIMVGFQKQSYDVLLKLEKDALSVTVGNMESVACDKDGKPTKGATSMKNPQSTMTKLAGLIQKDLAGRIKSWSDEEYAEKYDEAVSNPAIINCIAETTTSLYTSKFIENNNLIGKQVAYNVVVSEIKENKPDERIKKPLESMDGTLPEVYKYGYELIGDFNAIDVAAVVPEDTIGMLTGPKKTVTIFFYSNDDKLLMTKAGKEFVVKGTIKEVRLDKTSGKLSWITIWE